MQGDGCINYTYCGNHFTIYTYVKSFISYLKFPQLYLNKTGRTKNENKTAPCRMLTNTYGKQFFLFFSIGFN